MNKVIARLNELKLNMVAPILFIYTIGTFIYIILGQFGFPTDSSVAAILTTGCITIIGTLIGSNQKSQTPEIDQTIFPSTNLECKYEQYGYNENFETDQGFNQKTKH